MMDRADILTAMDTLKLYGMKGAFDAVIAAAVKRQHEPLVVAFCFDIGAVLFAATAAAV